MKRPFDVARIDHVVFRVRDLERSIAFYSTVLGCEVVRRRDHLGLVHLRAGASMIDLISFFTRPKSSNMLISLSSPLISMSTSQLSPTMPRRSHK